MAQRDPGRSAVTKDGVDGADDSPWPLPRHAGDSRRKERHTASVTPAAPRTGNACCTADEVGVQPGDACQTVLDTYELLEMILVRVDTKTLLLSQRVCRTFKAIIDRSSLLQQALFLKLAPVDGRRFGIDGVNPLLMRHTRMHIDRRSIDYNVYDPGHRNWFYWDFAPDDHELRITGRSGNRHELQLNYEALQGTGCIGWRYLNDGQPRKHHLPCTGGMERMYPMQTPYTWYERKARGAMPRMTLGELRDLCGRHPFFHRRQRGGHSRPSYRQADERARRGSAQWLEGKTDDEEESDEGTE